MARIMRSFKLAEISSVDRPAQAHAKAVIMKRENNSLRQSADEEPLEGTDTMAELDKAALEKKIAEQDAALKASTDNFAEVSKKLEDATAEIALLKMDASHREYMDNAGFKSKERVAFIAKSADDRAAYIEANPLEAKLPESVRKQLQEAEANKAALKEIRKREEKVTFAKRATDLGLTEKQGETLRKAYKGDEAAIAELERIIKGLTAAKETGVIFKEFGAAAQGDALTAADEIKAKADDLRKAKPSLTEAIAWTEVYTDPANVELKKRYDAEDMAKRYGSAA